MVTFFAPVTYFCRTRCTSFALTCCSASKSPLTCSTLPSIRLAWPSAKAMRCLALLQFTGEQLGLDLVQLGIRNRLRRQPDDLLAQQLLRFRRLVPAGENRVDGEQARPDPRVGVGTDVPGHLVAIHQRLVQPRGIALRQQRGSDLQGDPVGTV